MGTIHREYPAGNVGVLAILIQLPRWGLLYNLYADRLLGFNMFPQSVYETRECALLYFAYPCVDAIKPVR